MDLEERSRLCDRIINGFQIIKDQGRVYFIRDPLPLHRQLANEYYDEIFDILMDDGLYSKQELLELLIEKGMWSQQEEDELETLKKEIQRMKDDLPALEFKSREKKNLLNLITHAEGILETHLERKNSLLSISIENITLGYKYKKLLFFNCYDENEKRSWEDWDKFNTEVDEKLVNRLVNLSFFNNKITEKEIRELARTEPWRSMWYTAVKTGNLFPHAASQMTEFQQALVSWSLIYDSAFESMEPPSNDVVQNDTLFDKWLKDKSDSRKNGKDSQNSNSKINQADEVGIVVDSIDDAKRVYDLNSTHSKQLLNRRQRFVEKHGEVAEQHLPDRKEELRMKKNRLLSERARKK